MNNNKEENSKGKQTTQNTSGSENNPFENGQTAEQEIKASQEQLEKEQAFKTAQTERD